MTDKINTKTNIVERRHVYNKIVNVKASKSLIGKCITVHIENSNRTSLDGVQ